jgi:parvulin-like peptidyl-prolyl isomerase
LRAELASSTGPAPEAHLPRRESILIIALAIGCASSPPPQQQGPTSKKDPELEQARRDAEDAKRGRVEAEAKLEDSRREGERVKRELQASRETATATDGEARISQELLLKQKKYYEAKLALYKDLLGGKVPDDAAIASATATDAAPARKPTIDPDAPVAIVDGEPVARRELMEWLFLTQAPASIDTFLDAYLAQREARRLGIAVTDAEAEAFALTKLALIEQNAGGREKLDQELAKSNMTRDMLGDVLRANAKERALIEKLCLQDRTTKDYERRLETRAKQVYEKQYGERVDVMHLLMRLPADATEDVVQSALEAARKRREQLVQGEDWQKVAKDMTAGSGLPAQAQEKTYSRGDLAGAPEVEKLFFDTPEGEISPPTRLKGGIGIVKVVRRLPPQRTFDEVKEQLVGELKKPEVEEEELKALSARLREHAKIEKKLELK